MKIVQPNLGADASISLHDVVFTADADGNFRLVDQSTRVGQNSRKSPKIGKK